MKAKWEAQSPSGEIDRKQFAEGLQAIGISDPLLAEQYFNAFDDNGDGKIDFAEFATGLSVVQRGSVDERLRFMFDAYDADRNGVLTFDELYRLVKAVVTVRGDDLARDSAKLNQVVTETFAAVDTDGNGEIDFDEFCVAVKDNKLPIADLFINIEF
jgi:Ca2+-binding EF-hand superfamily protein